MDKVQIGVIIDSAKAFDTYCDATGKTPEKIPDGCNTYYTRFKADGKPALLIQQKDFALLPGEDEDDANGLMVLVADGANSDEDGYHAIETALEKIKRS